VMHRSRGNEIDDKARTAADSWQMLSFDEKQCTTAAIDDVCDLGRREVIVHRNNLDPHLLGTGKKRQEVGCVGR